jgi:hypothetical protein
MKNLTNFVVAAALVAALSSCAKEAGIGSNENPDTSVKIQVAYPKSDNTRAVGNPVKQGDGLAIRNGHILFVSKDNIVKKHVGVSIEAGSKQVSISDLESGEAVIDKVPGSATMCYIVANMPTGAFRNENLENTNIIEALDKINVRVGDIASATGDVSSVTIYGSGETTQVSGNTTYGNKPYQVSVVIALHTVAARLQIKGITGVGHLDGTKITSFTAKGIYLNLTDITAIGIWENYFKSGGGMRTTLENGQSVSDYTAEAYTSKGAASLMDSWDAGQPSGGTTYPTITADPAGNKLWAYNVLCNKVPHILIHFSEVKLEKSSGVEQTLTNKFITLRNFKYSKEENGHVVNAPVTEFLPDNVYTLENIEFNYTHLGEPEEKFIDALVNITPVTWKDNSIYWTGN